MKCPSCGFDNPQSMRFCGQCATPLAHICAQCGFESPGSFKFCGNCGSSMTAAVKHPSGPPAAQPTGSLDIPSAEIERRNVTVLFADLTGFTSLSEKLDPEDVHRTVNRYMEVLVERVKKYEGTIDKFTGDGLIALFGAPITHENDPERAVRAALEIHRALADVAAELREELGVTLQARIGINTGTAITGSVGSELGRDRYTALGDTVNVAARLQTSATPGTVLVSESTYRLTFPFFSFKTVGPLRVKGREEPVIAYEVSEVRSGVTSIRGARGLRAPLIGRESEYAQALALFERLRSEGEGALLLLSGEPGVGKSRLIRELLDAPAIGGLTVHEATAAAHDRNLSYALAGNLVRSGFALSEGLSAARQAALLEERLEELGLEAREHLAYFESVLGLPVSDPSARQRFAHLHAAQLRQQIFLSMRQWLLAEAKPGSLLLVLDDLHWADRLSFELLLFLLPLTEEAAVGFLLASRPADAEAVIRIEEFALQRLADRYHRLTVEPLTPAQSQELIRRLLGLSEMPMTLEELISGNAEGNPFFIEELVGVLIDQGVFLQEGDRWIAKPGMDFETLHVPATLDGLIMSRVDLLDSESRQMLQVAAVLGREFDSRVVSDILKEESTTEASGVLSRLEDRAFIIYTLGDARRDYAFRHGLTRETVYERLLKTRRRELHFRAAESLRQLYPEVQQEHPELLAEHYYLGTEPVRALEYALRAGHRARERFSNQDAQQFYSWVLDLLEKGAKLPPRELVELHLGLGDVRQYLGEYARALESYQAAVGHIRSVPGLADVAELADVTRRIGRTYERRGEYEEALGWLRLALSQLDEAGEPEHSVTRARIYNDLGWVTHRQGQQETAQSWFMRGLQILDGTDHYNEMAAVYHRLAASYFNRGAWDEAEDHALRGLRVREAIGDATGITSSLNTLGNLAAIRGDWGQAEGYLTRAMTISQKTGNVYLLTAQHSNLGLVFLYQGKFSEANSELAQSLALAEKIADPTWQCYALNNLAQLEYLQDNLGDALQYVQRALAIAEKIGHKEQQAEGAWIQALALLGVRETNDARQSAQLSLQLSQEIKDPQNEASALRALGIIEREEGKWDEGRHRLEESLKAFRRLKVRFDAAKSEFELGGLYRAMVEAGESPEGSLQLGRTHLAQALETFRALGAAHHIGLAEAELERLTQLEKA